MNEISTAQILYLKKQKRHKYIVSFSRVLILILFYSYGNSRHTMKLSILLFLAIRLKSSNAFGQWF